jgi:type II secretory pathway pseudopilin PulG
MLEGLVSIALMGTVVALVAGLLQQISRVGASLDESNRLHEQIRSVFPILRREAQAATVWITPAPGSTNLATALQCKVPDLGQESTRFPFPVPAPSSSGFGAPPPPTKFDDAGELIDCRYFTDEQGLWREATRGTNTARVLLSSSVLGLAVQRSSGRFLHVSLSVMRNRRVDRLSDTIYLPLRRGVAP